MPAERKTVQVLKYDGTEYRRWHARIAQQNGSLIVLDAEFDVDVSHHLLGEIKRGTRTVEYYWLDRWYNVFRFLNDDGTTRLFYCNINTPPTLKDKVLSYVDLDIDVLVLSDFSYQILDLDEFEQHARLFSYAPEVRESAQNALTEIISRIESHQLPFIQQKVSR